MAYFSALIKDRSLQLLIITNIITLVLAVIQRWDVVTVLGVYWVQTMVILVFNSIRVWHAKDVALRGAESLFRRVMYIPAKILLIVLMNVVPIFMLVGYVFILFDLTNSINYTAVFLGGVLFFCNHLFSFLYNRRQYSETDNVESLKNLTSIRVLPIHLCLLFGVFGSVPLVVFMLCKMGVDAVTHIIQHRILSYKLIENYDSQKGYAWWEK